MDGFFAFAWERIIPTLDAGLWTSILLIVPASLFGVAIGVSVGALRVYGPRPVVKTLDADNPREWYYALMDYGAFLKKTAANAGRKSSHYHKQSPFQGSNRQVRGRIVRYLTREGTRTEEELVKQLGLHAGRVRSALLDLEKEGMITRKGRLLKIG